MSKRSWVTSCGLGLIGLWLLAGGLHLAYLGGSWFYLVYGAIILASATFLWRRNPRAPLVYWTGLLMLYGWSWWEVGFDLWQLAGRLIGPTVAGIWLLLPPIARSLEGDPGPARDRKATTRGLRLVTLWVAAMGAALVIGVWQTYPADIASAVENWPSPGTPARTDGDWRNYGNDPGGQRFSPLGQITAGNVNQLAVAWTAHAGGGGDLEVTPLKIGTALYLCNSKSQVIALDAETGRDLWRYAPRLTPATASSTCRGVAYFDDARAAGPCRQKIISATADARLLALDAATGRPCAEFGKDGFVNLDEGLGDHPRAYHRITSAPTLVRGKIVLGGSVSDNQELGVPSGVIRAFDAHDGSLAWAWDLARPDRTRLPPVDENYTKGTPNSWGPMSADEALGLVYVPTGNPSADYWGGMRTPAMEKYGSSVVALDADTGKLRWTFQTTHHDVWDYDVASQPTLVDIAGPQGTIPALIQPTKRGQIFLLDRRTGRPVTPVVERPVSGGTTQGERLSPTQPFQPGMPDVSGPDLTERNMWGITPLDELWCRIRFREARYEGKFTPPAVMHRNIQFPGFVGSVNWGGVSVHPGRQIMIVNDMQLATQSQLVPQDRKRERGIMSIKDPGFAAAIHQWEGSGPQTGTPFAVETGSFVSPLRIPCQRPPYGNIAAIDLAIGKPLWRKPLGTARDSGPFGFALGLPLPMGTPNRGGSLTTASDLVFISATQERTLRAFDLRTGRILWSDRLPAGAHATPMTYLSPVSGRQFIVIAAAGSQRMMSRLGDQIVAYALPQGTTAHSRLRF